MPLQNRVTPDMHIVAESWRGDFMGNRGGRIHDAETKTLLKRKWASKRWIICVTKFKGRENQPRTLMGESYTELFFLDEVSALACGHRPCFECRRKAAKDYANAWVEVFGKPEKSIADGMDKQLHEERLIQDKSTTLNIDALPDGAMIKVEDKCFAKKGNSFWQWSGKGYTKASLPKGEILLLTPPSTITILKQGYQPQWHESAQ